MKETGKIAASYDPDKQEYYQNGIMYRVKKKWVLKEKWRVKI